MIERAPQPLIPVNNNNHMVDNSTQTYQTLNDLSIILDSRWK